MTQAATITVVEHRGGRQYQPFGLEDETLYTARFDAVPHITGTGRTLARALANLSAWCDDGESSAALTFTDEYSLDSYEIVETPDGRIQRRFFPMRK